ncbi:hypothetical protein ACTHGU_13400 [Chitinophagaceae bacterium MMS25-I14]
MKVATECADGPDVRIFTGASYFGSEFKAPEVQYHQAIFLKQLIADGHATQYTQKGPGYICNACIKMPLLPVCMQPCTKQDIRRPAAKPTPLTRKKEKGKIESQDNDEDDEDSELISPEKNLPQSNYFATFFHALAPDRYSCHHIKKQLRYCHHFAFGPSYRCAVLRVMRI